jgi:hypothetical protein
MTTTDPRLGSQIGLARLATIRKYNEDGTVLIALNEGGLHQVRTEFTVPIPMAWSGQEGEFLGGYPRIGSSVVASQGHGGKWFITSYVPSDGVFNNTTSAIFSSMGKNRLAALKPGRVLAQVKDGTRLFLDPDVGIQAGKANNFLHLESNLNVISHNFLSELAFTDATRNINGTIKRDLSDNSNRNILNSTLDSVAYDKSLFTIGMDPTAISTSLTTGPNIRNPALVENRQVVYEFSHSDGFGTDEEEFSIYADPASIKPKLKVSRREIRADALSLSLQYPNHLIETIQGTAVDIFGNIVDINRNPLPIGKINMLSLKQNPDKSEAFAKIRAQLRKSIAYHFEINARKGDAESTALPPPNVINTDDYIRDRSRYFFDIDKEGQIKLNIPASSEIGNVPLLVRHENYSVLLSSQDDSVNPNSFIKNVDSQDIYIESFAGKANIKLTSSESDTLDGYSSPIDRNTGKPITYGTAYHDITNTISEFQKTATYLQAGKKLVDFDTNNRLNTNWSPLEKVVSNNIIVSGPNANAGGRSGLINLDGFVSFSVGANTIDRQSMWWDMAGSLVSSFGRDLNNISWASSFDGDIYWQIGGPGIGNSFDSRFKNTNDAYRNGSLDIRVLVNGQNMIFRLGPEGVSIISPGTITFSAQQEIILRSNTAIKLAAETIVVHADDPGGGRIINKLPKVTI